MRAEPTRAGRVDASDCELASRDLRIEAICERYEAAWSGTPRPEIESHLVAVTEPERPALLRELLALEIDLRRGGGELPGARGVSGTVPGIRGSGGRSIWPLPIDTAEDTPRRRRQRALQCSNP